MTESEKKELIKKQKAAQAAEKAKADKMGQAVTFYAKADGGLAAAGNPGDKYSPTTSSWLMFVMGNRGGLYPDILSNF